MKAWFEDFKYAISRTLSDWWYPVSRVLFPRQRWLTKKIPNSWVDKDWLWELCLIEGLKHYVECDGGGEWFPYLDDDSQWQDGGEDMKEFHERWRIFHREVKRNYDIVTKTLPFFEKELEMEWKKIPTFDLDKLNDPNKPPYEVIYGEVNRLEKLIDNLKTEVMLWCVNNRQKIWT